MGTPKQVLKKYIDLGEWSSYLKCFEEETKCTLTEEGELTDALKDHIKSL